MANASGSGLVFEDSYGLDGTFASLTSSEQAALETDVQQAEHDLSSEFSNSVTASVDIEAVNDAGGGFLASNAASTEVAVTSSSYFNALESVSTSSDQSSAVAAIEQLTDLGGSSYVELPSAYARMLGLSNAGTSFTYSSVALTQGGPTYNLSSSVDDTIFLNLADVQAALDDQPANTPNDSVVGVIEHELTENVMGRVSSLLTWTFPGLGAMWAPADFFRVDSAGQSDLIPNNGTEVFFSPEPGLTRPASSLQFNNNTSGGDFADWTTTSTSDPGYTDPFGGGYFQGAQGSESSALSSTDIDLMNVLGWTIAPPPVVTAVPSVSLDEGQSIAAPSLIASISNPGGDDITADIYEDLGGGSGYFTVNGVRQLDDTLIYATPSENVQYVAGSSPGSDTLDVGIHDATTGSDIYASTSVVATTIHVAPSVTAVPSVSLDEGQSISASSLASVSNPSGDDILDYLYEDEGGGSGYFTLNGLKSFDDIPIYALPSDNVQYVAGSSPGSDTLTIGIYDATTGSYIYASNAVVATTIEPPGMADILFQSADGQAAIWDVNGTSVTGGGPVNPDPGPGWKTIGTGDFFGVGSSDILWQNADGQVAIWEMNGTILIGGGTVGIDPGPGWKAIGTGDFNDDGRSDILLQNTDGQVAVWEMNGTSVIGGGAVSPNPGPAWKAIGTGDFFGRGDSDILLQNPSTGEVAIWEMNGTSLVGGGAVNPNPGPSWKAIATGDFNHDGHSDILFQNPSSGQVAIWAMNGLNLIGGGTVSTDPGPSWQAIGTGGEGASDILFQNTASGQTALWEMNGTAVAGGGAVSANAGPSWKAVGLA